MITFKYTVLLDFSRYCKLPAILVIMCEYALWKSLTRILTQNSECELKKNFTLVKQTWNRTALWKLKYVWHEPIFKENHYGLVEKKICDPQAAVCTCLYYCFWTKCILFVLPSVSNRYHYQFLNVSAMPGEKTFCNKQGNYNYPILAYCIQVLLFMNRPLALWTFFM